MATPSLNQGRHRLSITNRSRELKVLGFLLGGLLIAGCNPGIIKMSTPTEFDTTASENPEQQKVVNNPRIDSGYLSVDAMYIEPGDPALPGNLKAQSGEALSAMCRSGLKYDDKELSSIVSLKIGSNGAIDNESIPVAGFTLKRSGSTCEIVGELKRVTNEYPMESDSVQVNYGLRASSGAEIPIEDIQNAIKIIGPALSPGTLVYRIATDAVLQNVGQAANADLKGRLSSDFKDSRSLTANPLSKSQAFYIPLQFHREDEQTLVGFIRIRTSINPSVFTSSIKNGFPDYSKATVRNFRSQDLNSDTTLKQFIASEENKIISNRNMSAQSLNQNCESISTSLAEDFALVRADRAYILNKILASHEKYNKPLPDRSKVDTFRLTEIQILREFTDLECLSSYRTILDEPSYGLDNRLGEYDDETALLDGRDKTIALRFKDSVYLFNELAVALNSNDQDYTKRVLKNNFLDSAADITIDNRVADAVLSDAGMSPSAKINSLQAAETLASRLSPGRLGCYVGLGNEQLRATLYASGYDAYALYKGRDQTLGQRGWLRIIIAHAQVEAGSRPAVSKVSLVRPDSNEHSFLMQNAGPAGVSSEACQQLLQEYQAQAI